MCMRRGVVDSEAIPYLGSWHGRMEQPLPLGQQR